MDAKARHSKTIKRIAEELGFAGCGIAKARYLEEEASNLENWLAKDYQGRMGYMENHYDKRLDPTKLVDGAKSVVSLLYNYYPKNDINANKEFKVAKYAFGKDYHDVIRTKLNKFLELIRDEIGEIDGRAFVDSAPVMERQWAALAGLGWLGKNGLLLNKQMGSFFFTAELIIELELEPDQPVTDHCGSCTRCIDACPTEAIVAPGVVNGSQCISYFTIELKSEFEIEPAKPYQDWVFGCDICQDVCPWNRFSKPHSEPAFEPPEELMNFSKREWVELTEDTFNRVFKGSAIKRTKLKGLQRNIKFVRDLK